MWANLRGRFVQNSIGLLFAVSGLSAGCSDTNAGNQGGGFTAGDNDADGSGLSGFSDLGQVNNDSGTVDVSFGDFKTGPEDFGKPCNQATDCASGWCVQNDVGKVCSKTCTTDCDPGWTCNQVQSGVDTAFICMPKFLHLCEPCGASADCNENNGLDHKCVPFASGSFCGAKCDPASSDCPANYACQQVLDPDSGKNLFQCIPNSGQCTCSALAVANKASTPCNVKNIYGTCTGNRTCTVAGLSACNAKVPATESCNGLDDDCNGLTDDFGDAAKCKTTNEFGTCDGGSYVCKDGKQVCSAPDAKPETCNGYDDDCDGKTDEGLCDDGNPCTIDTCNTDGSCKNFQPPNAGCDDGDACTTQDKCIDGKCVGGAQQICDDQNPCTMDVCDVIKGCIKTAADVGKPCVDDGDPCTTDACDATGKCTHTTQSGICTINGQCVAAGSIDPSNPCKVCNPLQSKTAYVLQNGLSCDDGDTCTVADKCSAGICKGKAMDCSGLSGPCTQGLCSQGACLSAPKPGPCEDGNACTSGDTCVSGQCVGTPKDCSNLDSACTAGVCESGVCMSKPKPSSCDDGNPCTVGDSCASGGCKGTLLDCSGLDGPCGKGMCQGGTCTAQPANSGAVCNDGNPCTYSDTCANGKCAGTSKDCSALSNACGPGLCNISTGVCGNSVSNPVCTPGQVENGSQGCGNCGNQTRTRTCTASCGWGAWSAWGTCSGQGVCAAGASESASQGCGNCGTQSHTRSCSSSCQWNAWPAWSTCSGQGVCAPGAQSTSCGDPCAAKVCSSSCQWGACGLKPGAQCLYKNGSNYQCCGTKKWQFCNSDPPLAGGSACSWFPCQAATNACF